MKITKKKIAVLILSALIVLFGIYAGIDQIIFQSRKAEYVAAVKQYVSDVVAANSITQDEEKKGSDWIAANQKKKMNLLRQKYLQDSKSDITAVYLQTLEKDLANGWKWHGGQIEDVKESAWKSPFQREAHVTLTYSVTVPCDSGGVVWYTDDVEEMEVEKGQHTIKNYYDNEYTVSGWEQKHIECVFTKGSNQKELSENSSSRSDIG